MTWQSIETAPKDDQLILVWAGKDEYEDAYYIAMWHHSRRRWVSMWNTIDEDAIEPSHWMPLPEPPNYEPTEAQQGLIPIPEGYKEP